MEKKYFGLTEKELGMIASFMEVSPTAQGILQAKDEWKRAGSPVFPENKQWVENLKRNMAGLFA